MIVVRKCKCYFHVGFGNVVGHRNRLVVGLTYSCLEMTIGSGQVAGCMWTLGVPVAHYNVCSKTRRTGRRLG
jgi:hypothetical protein